MTFQPLGIEVTPSKSVKRGVLERLVLDGSRAPPTRIMFQMYESQQDRLVVHKRFHNLAKNIAKIK